VKRTFLAIEYNWNRVGGVFSTRRKAAAWCKRQETVEPNLMWEVYPFDIDTPISDEEAVQDLEP
jgi:hypothetical protein